MPYSGEVASKASHIDIVRNPTVTAFLKDCDFLTVPSEDEGRAMGARFMASPPLDGNLPEHVIAVDGSYYETSINERLPSTKVGYVKVGAVLISLTDYGSLRAPGGRMVDPFKVAALMDNNSSLAFALPSANIRARGKASVRDSFRAAVDSYLYSENTRFRPDDPKTSLRTTLFHLASRRPGRLGTADEGRLKIHKCPLCERPEVEVQDVPGLQLCPGCGGEVYPSDCLRLWEEVSEYQSNVETLSRFMLQVEHMLPIHYARFLLDRSPASLSSLAFFLDGPLAVFGSGAWLHATIMRWLAEARARLAGVGKPMFLVIGLQKTGQVVDHVSLIDKYIQANRMYAIDDAYRYRYIIAGRDPSSNGFGSETYYGQDFIYKTPSGRTFVFAIPYPGASKAALGRAFIKAKTELGHYSELPRALALIHHFESDLYENAVVPIALAHRYTAISLEPGGKVLDLLTRRHIFHANSASGVAEGKEGAP